MTYDTMTDVERVARGTLADAWEAVGIIGKWADWLRDGTLRVGSETQAALNAIAALQSATPVEDDVLIEEAVQAALDAGLAVNGEHGVGAARHAARYVVERLSSTGGQGND